MFTNMEKLNGKLQILPLNHSQKRSHLLISWHDDIKHTVQFLKYEVMFKTEMFQVLNQAIP